MKLGTLRFVKFVPYCLIAGCASNLPNTTNVQRADLPDSKKQGWTRKADENLLCFYATSMDGRIFRLSPSGRVSELVVNSTGHLTGVGFSRRMFAWEKYDSCTAVGVMDGEAGYLTVDTAPLVFSRMYFSGARKTEVCPLFAWNTGGPTGWTMVVESEPIHDGFSPSKLTFNRGHGPVSTYVFVNQRGSVLAAMPSGHVWIVDGSDLVIFDLPSGKSARVAIVRTVTPWPRDLRMKDRFRPVCKTSTRVPPGDENSSTIAIYKWQMKDPNDFKIRPEYRTSMFDFSKPAHTRFKSRYGKR